MSVVQTAPSLLTEHSKSLLKCPAAADWPEELREKFTCITETAQTACRLWVCLRRGDSPEVAVAEATELKGRLTTAREAVQSLEGDLVAERTRLHLPHLDFLGIPHTTASNALLNLAETVALEARRVTDPACPYHAGLRPADPAEDDPAALNPELLKLHYQEAVRHFRTTVSIPDPGPLLSEARVEFFLLTRQWKRSDLAVAGDGAVGEQPQPNGPAQCLDRQGPPPPVWLGGPDDPPWVMGRRLKDPLSPGNYKSVRALVLAYPNGLSPEELNQQTGLADARRELAKLCQEYPDPWGAVIDRPAFRPGRPHGSGKLWRLRWPEAVVSGTPINPESPQ
jgi:hypothetical protein